MKRLLLLSLLLGFIPSVKADSVCVLTSETYPEFFTKDGNCIYVKPWVVSPKKIRSIVMRIPIPLLNNQNHII